MTEAKPDFIQISVRIPRQMRKDLDRLAAEWRVDMSSIVRSAVEDGMKSWAKQDAGEDLESVLGFLKDRAVAIQAMLNLMNGDAMDDAYFARLEAVKARIVELGGARS